jgi:DNA-binding protein HU-beta
MTAARALLSTLPREELKKMTKEIREMITNAPKEEKVKRPAAVGQKAWFAFMAHCRATLAERFTTCKTAPEYAVVCGEIRKEDEAVYKAFVEKFKAENSATPSDAPAAPKVKPAAKAKSAEEKEAAKLAKELEKEQKAATKSAEKAAKKEAARLAKEGAYLAKEAAKEAAKQQKAAEKEAAKLAKLAAKPAKPTKAKAKATAPISAEATPAPAEPEEDVMPKLTIAGVTYFHDESSNGLYGIDAATNGLSHWVGFFQPDNEAEPIRYTASEGDDE